MSETVVVKEWKKFRRYDDGAAYYGLCKSTFIKLANDAKAVHKVGKAVLVNCEIFEEYLETFRIVE